MSVKSYTLHFVRYKGYWGPDSWVLDFNEDGSVTPTHDDFSKKHFTVEEFMAMRDDIKERFDKILEWQAWSSTVEDAKSFVINE